MANYGITTDFVQVNAPMQITIEASDEGDKLVFRNAILARAETNKNQDEITTAGIAELASTIAGTPIDIEHRFDEICGVFTSGKAINGNKELSVDGVIWANRYPDIARGVKEGAQKLSIEAVATYAKCSVCGSEYENAQDYCNHLTARYSTGATRQLHKLKAQGGGVTLKPAGTNTAFNPAQVYFVASHNELTASHWYEKYLKDGETLADLPDSDFADPKNRRFPYKIHGVVKVDGFRAAWSAAHGSHTGEKDQAAIDRLKRDKPKEVEISTEGAIMDDTKEEVKEVEEEKKEGEVEACDTAQVMSAEAMQAEMQAKLATMQAELEKSVAEKAQLEASVKELSDKLAATETERNELKASLRKKELTPYFTDEDFNEQKDELLNMSDKQFHILKASLNKVKPLDVGVYVPERSKDGGKPPLALK